MRVRENTTDLTTYSVQSAHNVTTLLHYMYRTVSIKITESSFVMFSQLNYSITILIAK